MKTKAESRSVDFLRGEGNWDAIGEVIPSSLPNNVVRRKK